MIPFRKSIGFRLFAISFILLALPLLVDSFIIVQNRYERAIGEAKAYLVEVAHLRELPLSYIRPLNEPVIALLSTALNLDASFPEKENKELNEKLKEIAKVGDFFGVFLLKITPEDRVIVVASGQEDFIGKDYTDFFKLNQFFSEGSPSKSGYATYISYDTKNKRPYYIASQVIYSDENKPIGVIAVSYDISDRLKELLTPDTHHYKVNFAILLPSGIVFAASDPRLKFKYFAPLPQKFLELFKKENPSAEGFLPDIPIQIEDTIGFPFFEFKWRDLDQIGYIQKMHNVHFSLLAYAARKDIFKSPFANFLRIFSGYAIILIVGGLLALFLIKRMAKPIQNLSKVMTGIQKGDLSRRYNADSLGFEINTLGEIFNKMIDDLLAQKHLAEEARIAKETFAKELRLGQQVQRTLLPQKMPSYIGVELAEVYIPAIEVGGDFFDVFVKENKGNKQLVLAIADASGKGVRACFYSLNLRNMMRVFAKEFENVAHAMAMANYLFCKDAADTGMFVTAIMGIYDSISHSFQYFSCGHNPLIVLRKSGEIEMLDHQGAAIGVATTENNFVAHSVVLQPQDTLLLYTDGITEAHNSKNELYGENRLMSCLKKSTSANAKDIVNNIVQDVNAFVGEAPQHDDITLLAMKVLE